MKIKFIVFQTVDQTLREVSKNKVFSGPYFPIFSPNTGKYGPEKTPIWTVFTK